MTTIDQNDLIRIRDNPALWPEPQTSAPDDEGSCVLRNTPDKGILVMQASPWGISAKLAGK